MIDNGKLLGELPGHVLALHKGKEKIDKYVKRVPHIRYDNDEKDVINSFLKHPHDKVVVLDENEDIIGVIHSDDLLALLDKRRSSDLYGLAGVNKEEDATDGLFTKVRFRWLWLIINLGTAFLAASVVGMFEDTISKFTLLAVYMPIVAGMGGNAATQTLAVTVRGIVMQEISLKNSVKYIAREIGAGVINGAINGILVAAVAVFINKNPMLGLVLAIAMVCNLFIAAFAGALIPLIMKKLGKDPATSATIFITTCTDVGGFFVFLSLAQALLK
jgi:magnesium transporter